MIIFGRVHNYHEFQRISRCVTLVPALSCRNAPFPWAMATGLETMAIRVGQAGIVLSDRVNSFVVVDWHQHRDEAVTLI
jgi:hypothetical protein